MAQVPNFYYNSPWIAQAANSLASALAPPDPDKLLAREHLKLQMESERTKNANTITDRENAERSRGAIGKLYALQSAPILGPDGKPDKKATEAEAFRLADEAMTFGPKDVRAEVDDALFNLSPGFRTKRILQTYTQNAQADRLTRSLAGALDQIRLRGGIQEGLQNDQQDFELERLDKLYGLRWKELEFRAANAAKGAGQKPLTISPALGKAITAEVLKRERATGNKLTDEDRFRIVARIAEHTQSSRDPYSSAGAVWNAEFPQHQFRDAATQQVSETDADFGVNSLMRILGLDPTDTYLAPAGGEQPAAAAPEPAVDPNSLGAAAITPPVVAPPLTPNDRIRLEGELTRQSNERAAADTAAMPLPDAKPPKATSTKRTPPPKNRLKEGINTTFANGEVWTLKGGVPTFVRMAKK
jgi:hypothetical protein